MESGVEALLNRIVAELHEIKNELRLLRNIIVPEEEISEEEKRELQEIQGILRRGNTWNGRN